MLRASGRNLPSCRKHRGCSSPRIFDSRVLVYFRGGPHRKGLKTSCGAGYEQYANPSMNHSSFAPILTEDEARVHAWAEVRELLELQLAPLGRRALKALAAKFGESVLDIGCGGGTTALGPRRRSRARRYRRGDGCVGSGAGVRARVGPGVRAPAVRPGGCARASLEPASFDAAFSRFGVMFFSKPAVAFSNIRRSLRPKGRLSFVCWRTLEENSLDNVPLTAASLHLPPQPAQDPDAPGPFAFANPGSGSPHSENSGLHGYRDNCL
jgi:SAM-dependent methyltransferase